MPAKWREYQQEAAEFFRRFGLTATVEKEVEGVRGLHAVDVFVEARVGWVEQRDTHHSS